MRKKIWHVPSEGRQSFENISPPVGHTLLLLQLHNLGPNLPLYSEIQHSVPHAHLMLSYAPTLQAAPLLMEHWFACDLHCEPQPSLDSKGSAPWHNQACPHSNFISWHKGEPNMQIGRAHV